MRNQMHTKPNILARDSLASHTGKAPSTERVRDLPRMAPVTVLDPLRQGQSTTSMEDTSTSTRSDIWPMAAVLLGGLAFAVTFVAYVLFPAMQTLVK